VLLEFTSPAPCIDSLVWTKNGGGGGGERGRNAKEEARVKVVCEER
jgi:hypothetical protein